MASLPATPTLDPTPETPSNSASPNVVRRITPTLLLRIGVGISAALFILSTLVTLFYSGTLYASGLGWLGFFHGIARESAIYALLNLSLFLMTWVGVRARERWSLLLVLGIAVFNVLVPIRAGYWPAVVFAVLTVLALVAGVLLIRERREFRPNPVAVRELRGRMRGARAFTVLTIYLALMSGIALLSYFIFNAAVRGGSTVGGELGRTLFVMIVAVEMMLIIFIAPAFTSGAITGERERQTYDLLRTTLLTAPSFVIGKLESALGYLFLLLLAAIPLQSIAFLFGGVGELEVVLAFVILMMMALALGSFGIYFSASENRTLSANLGAYGVALTVMFALPIALGVILGLVQAALRSAFFQPGWDIVVRTLLAYLENIVTSLNPISTALVTQQLLIERQTLLFYSYTLPSGGTTILVSPWVLFTLIYLSVSAVLLLRAMSQAHRENVT